MWQSSSVKSGNREVQREVETLSNFTALHPAPLPPCVQWAVVAAGFSCAFLKKFHLMKTDAEGRWESQDEVGDVLQSSGVEAKSSLSSVKPWFYHHINQKYCTEIQQTQVWCGKPPVNTRWKCSWKRRCPVRSGSQVTRGIFAYWYILEYEIREDKAGAALIYLPSLN